MIGKVPASWHEDWSLHPKHLCKKLGNLVPSCNPSAGGMRWGRERWISGRHWLPCCLSCFPVAVITHGMVNIRYLEVSSANDFNTEL